MSDNHNKNQKKESGRFAYDGLERIFHEKARLGIMTSLMSNKDGLIFGELKSLVSLTDGNLSRHIQQLKDEGLVEVLKGYENNRPQTLCRITEEGRNRFLAYVQELEKVVQDASKMKAMSGKSKDFPLDGWVTV